jgi:hypothetical protein
MKKSIGSGFFAFVLLTVLLSGCAPATTPIPPTSKPSQTMPPTFTPEPAATFTATSTATLSPQGKIINRVKPENPETYSNSTDAILYTVTEDQFNKMLENVQNLDPVSICPEIWIEPVPGEPNPLYALFINASQDDKKKGFIFAIHSTIPEMEPYIVGVGVIPADANGKFIMAVKYQPAEGSPKPEELEIQVVFQGCEIYKETVTWS